MKYLKNKYSAQVHSTTGYIFVCLSLFSYMSIVNTLCVYVYWALQSILMCQRNRPIKLVNVYRADTETCFLCCTASGLWLHVFFVFQTVTQQRWHFKRYINWNIFLIDKTNPVFPSSYQQTSHRHTSPLHRQCRPPAAPARPRCEAGSCTRPGTCDKKKNWWWTDNHDDLL